MNKLAIAATAAALLVSGLMISGHALAQYPGFRGWVDPPIGERGAKWGKQCWIGDMYFGYWGACPKPKAAAKPAKPGKG
jgi:hypothetical protein